MTMRLSEAISLGAMLHPQAFEMLRSPDGQTCALGAALDAVGGPQSSYLDLYCHWPDMLHLVVTHPVLGVRTFLEDAIAGLNDRHRWTREAIADWVETIEDAGMAAHAAGPRAVALLKWLHTPQGLAPSRC